MTIEERVSVRQQIISASILTVLWVYLPPDVRFFVPRVSSAVSPLLIVSNLLKKNLASFVHIVSKGLCAPNEWFRIGLQIMAYKWNGKRKKTADGITAL